ncbi:4Fe-4S ferredoxin [Mycolicibacterium mageritense DSM 44476 = CIP 104973]|uniref:Ferredoxin n=1 Tax=Mycolicibacterium mageritense TaxID=53462 RepID=A0ABM7HM90_MYCME|nr:ferredoxin family protein [Mycolicibacterium mageritense]MCC9183894.1 ferredoxin family protein [Mycolicibacterium mageritense]BBX31617.1 ferredoxin [Mycolicibacterium mageritense]CDO23832.1 4Fe-4S ferredoxin [Mycolicibacterium mageritense DSM 44476 = CIP 104973]
MIEIVSTTACIACDICIKVCPTDVFDRGTDGVPVIARQADCQTCFMCEAYCPVDALYVSPVAEPVGPGSPHASVEAVAAAGLFGEYRELIGWGAGRTAGARLDKNPVLASVPPLPESRLPVPAVVVDGPWNHTGASQA